MSKIERTAGFAQRAMERERVLVGYVAKAVAEAGDITPPVEDWPVASDDL